MTDELNREEMTRIVNARKLANEERYKHQSKESLIRNVGKKFKTTMIGALAKFEDNFGVLWGHTKEEHELTDNEKMYRELWNLTRTEVLNNGNNQQRAATEEIGNYTVSFDKFETNFILKDKGDITDDREN